MQSLSIVVVAQDHNPTILNPDFLYRNSIVPKDWRTAGDPICVSPVAQVAFQTGVMITAQFDKVVFVETIGSNLPDVTRVGEIALKYIDTLPHVAYSAVGINPHGHVLFESEAEARSFIAGRLLAEGPWKKLGKGNPAAAVKLTYDLDDAQCSIAVDQARLRAESGTEPLHAVTFAGNFHRDLAGPDHDAKALHLQHVISNWKEDYHVFVKTVNEAFLSEG